MVATEARRAGGTLTSLGLILAKDLRVEWRTREIVTSMGLPALLLVIVLGAGRADAAAASAPTAMWVTYAFGAALGFARTFAQERGGLSALRLAPIDGAAVVLAKTAANWLALLIVQIVSLPVLGALLTEQIWTRLGALALPLILGGLALAVVGTLLGALLVQTRLREVLLPLLMLPVILPALIAAIGATTAILDGQPVAAVGAQLQLLFAFDILFGATSLLLFDVIVEE
jgi:heme exporter protein B